MKPLRLIKLTSLAVAGIAATALASLYIYEPTPIAAYAHPPEPETIKRPGERTLAFLQSGDLDGRPVFYFHGGPGSRLESLLFEELNIQLGIRMISLDRPGYGASDFQPDRSYLDWPDDVRAVADHLGLDDFGVIGFSSGGPYGSVVAYAMPERVGAVALVGGEAPYRHDDYPWDKLGADSFSLSGMNKLFTASATHAPVAMRSFFRLMRIMVFADPVGIMQSSGEGMLSQRDIAMYSRDEFALSLIESMRQSARGVSWDYVLERRDWPFALEEITTPEVLVFHGQEDGGVDPALGQFVCDRIPACTQPVFFPGEGHSAVLHRYDEIIAALLAAWDE